MPSDYIDNATRVAAIADAKKLCTGTLIARYKTTISRLHAGGVVVYLGTAPSSFRNHSTISSRLCCNHLKDYNCPTSSLPTIGFSHAAFVEMRADLNRDGNGFFRSGPHYGRTCRA